MARIKIKDLPRGMAVSKEEMRKVFGGALNPAFSFSSAFGDPACWSAIDDPLSSSAETDFEAESSGSSNSSSTTGDNKQEKFYVKPGTHAVAGVRG
jgi:hypothetical protein